MLLDEKESLDKATLWWGLPAVAFDTADFETKFCQKKKEAPGALTSDASSSDILGALGGAAAASAEKKKLEKTKVLDPKRSNAVGILASRLPPPKAVKTAIAALDDTALERDQLEQIRSQLPTPEETEQLSSMDGPDVVWDRPEAFVLMLTSIPRLSSRLRCWSVRRAFDEAAEAMEAPLKGVTAAFMELRACVPLRSLFGMLLSYGNHLNGGNTSKGQADGFEFTELMTVCNTKATSGKHTLLSYALLELTSLAKGENASVAAKAADALKLEASLPSLRDAIKVDLAELQSQHATLDRDVKEVAKCAASEPETPAHLKRDPFKDQMTSFAKRAAERVAALGAQAKKAEGAVSDARAFFGLSAKHVKDDEILPFFAAFLDAVKKAMPPPEKPPKPKLPPLPPPGMLQAAIAKKGVDAAAAKFAARGGVDKEPAKPFNPAALAAEAAAKKAMNRAAARTAAGEDAASSPPVGGGGGGGGGGNGAAPDPMEALIAAIHSGRPSRRISTAPKSAKAGPEGGEASPAWAKSKKGGSPEGGVAAGSATSASGNRAASGDGERSRAGSRAAVQLDPSLFGRSNDSYRKESGLGQANNARSSILSKLKEQESRSTIDNGRGGGAAAGKARPVAGGRRGSVESSGSAWRSSGVSSFFGGFVRPSSNSRSSQQPRQSAMPTTADEDGAGAPAPQPPTLAPVEDDETPAGGNLMTARL